MAKEDEKEVVLSVKDCCISDPVRFDASQSSGRSQPACKFKEYQRSGRVASRIGLGENAGLRIKLLAELVIPQNGFAPFPHQELQRFVLAIKIHPPERSQGGERLRGSAPAIARNRTNERRVILGDTGERIAAPECLRVVQLPFPDGCKDFAIVAVQA